jgi:zinc transport system substrate-binding protein
MTIVVMSRPASRIITALAGLAATCLALAGCTGAGTGAGTTAGSGGHKVAVLASFYPLQYVTKAVGGDLVEVSSLTPPGVEPHDIELAPSQVRSVSTADLVVYLSGFQSAVDQAVESRRPANVVDVATDVTLAPAPAGGQGLDPHFWLDPQLLSRIAAPVAQALGKADPAHAATYATNAKTLETELGTLDAEYAAGLATCQSRVFVTSHAAFGYLAARYGLEMVAVSGLDPEAEPSPARLKEIGDVVRAKGVSTIFSEVLLSTKVAQALATDLGITTAVLDPVESLADPNSDYRAVMEKNLTALRSALRCS